MTDVTMKNPETMPLQEWEAADANLAKTLWGDFGAGARRLFSILMDSPGRKFSGEELAELLNAPHGRHSVAGWLGTPGKQCLLAGREPMWRWDYPKGQTARYWMTDEQAALFRQARNS
ncbi:DUF6416 domain-containing protein [Amycolatopsis sp. NPDC059021]|uniref:DUF6416 domain-containing protein n=1 Tax=Amycolatopsis sp. NPDC059021 TaxID=3346704 RepID=UPI00366FC162